MKKILMVAMLSTFAMGAFANVNKPKKHKRCQHCTQNQCTRDCKADGACNKSNCAKV